MTHDEDPKISFDSFPAKLSAALVKAQRAARDVAKDGFNKFHKYEYATSESLIEEGKVTLGEQGLALLQLDVVLLMIDRDAEGKEKYRNKATIQYVLLHESGEMIRFARDWPCVETNGRPADKAEGGALTTALGYTYRDLLSLKRVDENEMNHRDGGGRREEERQPERQEAPRQEERRDDRHPEVNEDDIPPAFRDNDRATQPSKAWGEARPHVVELIQSRKFNGEQIANAIGKYDLKEDERIALDFVSQLYAEKNKNQFVKTTTTMRERFGHNEGLLGWVIKITKPAFEELTREPEGRS
jgi:hypothetical protein